jgi:Na+:H+ antiporter, NhaA family
MKSETKLLAVMGAIVALGAAFLTFNRDPTITPPKPPATPAPLTEARFAQLEKSTRHFKGAADARYTVIEFADFQCPSCRAVSELAVRRFAKDFPQIRFGFRHFPLEQIHPNAMSAAVLSEIAAEKGSEKFWETYEALMKNPKEELTAERVDKVVTEVGLDGADVKQKRSDAKYADRVVGDRQLGIDMGVNETPTFFVKDSKTKRVMMVVGYKQLYPELKEIPNLPLPADPNAPE